MPKKLNHSLFERQPFSKQVLCTFTICSYMALNNTACTLEFINLYGHNAFEKHSADVLIPPLSLNIQTTRAELSDCYHFLPFKIKGRRYCLQSYSELVLYSISVVIWFQSYIYKKSLRLRLKRRLLYIHTMPSNIP